MREKGIRNDEEHLKIFKTSFKKPPTASHTQGDSFNSNFFGTLTLLKNDELKNFFFKSILSVVMVTQKKKKEWFCFDRSLFGKHANLVESL